jgi:hypothetical protein
MPKENPPDLNSILEALQGRRKYPASWLGMSPIKEFAAQSKPPQYKMTEANIDRFEEDTIKAASGAIRVLEDALAKWDAIHEKPDELQDKFDDYRKFHAELVEWEQRILKSRAKGEKPDFTARVDRLLEYSRICMAHR